MPDALCHRWLATGPFGVFVRCLALLLGSFCWAACVLLKDSVLLCLLACCPAGPSPPPAMTASTARSWPTMLSTRRLLATPASQWAWSTRTTSTSPYPSSSRHHARLTRAARCGTGCAPPSASPTLCRVMVLVAPVAGHLFLLVSVSVADAAEGKGSCWPDLTDDWQVQLGCCARELPGTPCLSQEGQPVRTHVCVVMSDGPSGV